MDFKKITYDNKLIYWCILIIFSLFCTLKMADFCLSGGILNPDISLYLISALKYAGIDYYGLARPEELFYTPIISFLTSLIFRLGYVDKAAIIIVTSILCFLSYIGLYMLLKIRFNSLLSLCGVIIYGSTSIIIFNLSKGLIDIPFISISIWSLYFAILAIDDNPKFYLISFPLLVVAFFTKYMAGFILPIILLYYLMKRNFVDNIDSLIFDRTSMKCKIRDYFSSKEFKYIIISIFFSLILAYIICKTLLFDFGGSLTFIQQSINTFNAPTQDINNPLVILDKSYYFDKFPFILYDKMPFGLILSGLLYSIFGISIIIQVYRFIKNDEIIRDIELFKTKHFEKILAVLFIFSLIGVCYGFIILENNLFSNLCFLSSILIFNAVFKKYLDDNKCLSITLLFFAFFIVYFIFLSLYPIKLYRYSLPLIIPFVCIIVWSLDCILTFITNGLNGFKCEFDRTFSKKSNILLIILIIILLISTITFMVPMQYERSNHVYQEVLFKGYSDDLAQSCDYIMENDSDYHSKTFASFPNSARTIMWYLQTNVTIIDEDTNMRDYDNSTYLILYKNVSLNNYHEIHKCGDFYIYYHN